MLRKNHMTAGVMENPGVAAVVDHRVYHCSGQLYTLSSLCLRGQLVPLLYYGGGSTIGHTGLLWGQMSCVDDGMVDYFYFY